MLSRWETDVGEWLVGLPEVLQRALDKAIVVQRSPVTGYVALLRRARPHATPAEIIAVLERQYLTAVTGTGATVGAAAAAPGIGTVLALALSGGETAVFYEATALFALAIAEVHGIRGDEVERRRSLVVAVVFGDHEAPLIEEMTDRTKQHRDDLPSSLIPRLPITAISNLFGRWFFSGRRRRRNIPTIGRIAPFGIGVATGAAGSRAYGHLVLNTSRRVFGPPPARFTDRAGAEPAVGSGPAQLKDAPGRSAER